MVVEEEVVVVVVVGAMVDSRIMATATGTTAGDRLAFKPIACYDRLSFFPP